MKKQQIELPEKLWKEQSVDLTRHSYQGQLLSKRDGFKLGKTQRKKIPADTLLKAPYQFLCHFLPYIELGDVVASGLQTN